MTATEQTPSTTYTAERPGINSGTLEPTVRTGSKKERSDRWWAARVAEVKDIQSGQCLICGWAADEKLGVHHISYPMDGTDNNRANLVALCYKCHGFIHGHTERPRPFASRIIQCLLILGPDKSIPLFRVCRLLFRAFVKR
jgi:5-methylcytosine-specific restriction endonuclease McrA